MPRISYPHGLIAARRLGMPQPAIIDLPCSLSDFGIVGCETSPPVHFSPLSWAIVRLLPGEIGKNCPRRGRFSLSTTKVRQAPSARAICTPGKRPMGRTARVLPAHGSTRPGVLLPDPCQAASDVEGLRRAAQQDGAAAGCVGLSDVSPSCGSTVHS